MKSIVTACAFAAAFLISFPAGAVAITGLYNTGQGIASGSADTHYSLTATQGSTALAAAQAYAASNGVWPISPWMANGDFSKWITPTLDQGQSYDAWQDGLYRYRLTFDLSGYAPSTAKFSGRFMADNAAQVFLNGSLLSSGSSFSEWTTFSASTGFKAGLNTVDFVVRNFAQNGGNPTGLRTEFTSSSVSAVPEPGSAAVFMTGLGLMGLAGRRRKLSRSACASAPAVR